MCRLPIDKNSGRINRARPAKIHRFKVLKSPKRPKTPTALAEGVLGKRGGKTDIGSYWCEWWESNPLSNQTLLSPLALCSRPLSSVMEISCGFGRNRPKPTRVLGVLGLFATGRASLSYLTEALVHIYIPQPRGDLAVESLCRESLTSLSWASLFFRVALPLSVLLL